MQSRPTWLTGGALRRPMAGMKWVLVAITTIVLTGDAFGQSTAIFQVASIKPNRSGDGASTWNISPGELVMRNITLKQLVQIAYDVRDYSMSGPVWLESERFD